MLKLLRNLRRQEWAMAAVCAVLILGQINFCLLYTSPSPRD